MKTRKLIFSVAIIGVFILLFTGMPITMNAYAETTWKCYIYPNKHTYPGFSFFNDPNYYDGIIIETWTKDNTGKYIQGMSLYVNVMDFLAVKERRVLIKENASGMPVLYPDANFLGIINLPVDKREIYVRAEYTSNDLWAPGAKQEVRVKLEIRTSSGESGIERKYYTFKLYSDDYKKILIEGANITMIDTFKPTGTSGTSTNTSTATGTSTDTEPATSAGIDEGTLLDMDGNGTLDSAYSDKDHDGMLDFEDSDMDGDGKPNDLDSDMDGDDIENSKDADDDGDGISDTRDPWPVGFAPDCVMGIRDDRDEYLWLIR